MAAITDNTIRNSVPITKKDNFKVDTSEGTIFAGEFYQSSAGTNHAIPLGVKDGIYAGYTKEQINTDDYDAGDLCCEGGMITNLDVENGSTYTELGYAFYGTSNNDLVARYASSAKFMGYIWTDGTAYSPVILGRESLVANLLAGGPRGYANGGVIEAANLADDQRYIRLPVEARAVKVTEAGFIIHNQLEGSAAGADATVSLRNGTATLSSTYTTTIGTGDSGSVNISIAAGEKFGDGEEVALYIDGIGNADMTAGRIEPYVKYDNVLQ